MANWIKGAIRHPGSLTKAAKSKGMTPAQFCATHPKGKNAKRCALRKTLVRMNHPKPDKHGFY